MRDMAVLARLKSLKSSNLSTMSMRDMAVSMRLKKNIQQSVHHVDERCGSVGKTDLKSLKSNNLSTMSVRDVAGLVRLK